MALAQHGPLETNLSRSKQWGPLQKLSAPLVDKFCTRTEITGPGNGFHKKEDLLGSESSGISLALLPPHSPGSGFLGVSAERKWSQRREQRLPEPAGDLPPDPDWAPEAPPLDWEAFPQALPDPADTSHRRGTPVHGEAHGEAWLRCLSLVGVRSLSILFLEYHLVKQ